MKPLCEIDRNFRIPEGLPAGLSFYDPQQPPFSVWGLADNPRGVYCRLPVCMLPGCSEGVQRLAYHLAGGCIRFTTDAAQLAVVYTLLETGNMPHFAASGQSGMELFEETDEGARQIHCFLPAMNEGHGCRREQALFCALPGGLRHYALLLPLYNGVQNLRLGLDASAQVLPGRAPRLARPIAFYGSSITQGGCAGKAGNAYASILARRLDAPIINLGFSGNAMGEAHIARYIASLSLSALVLDYDYNAPSAGHLAATHEPFFEIIRKAQPELPILMLSRPNPEKDPQESAAREEIVRRTYMHALERGDKRVYRIPGRALLGEGERSLCTVDGTHPNDLGFLRMADAIEPTLRRALETD